MPADGGCGILHKMGARDVNQLSVPTIVGSFVNVGTQLIFSQIRRADLIEIFEQIRTVYGSADPLMRIICDDCVIMVVQRRLPYIATLFRNSTKYDITKNEQRCFVVSYK